MVLLIAGYDLKGKAIFEEVNPACHVELKVHGNTSLFSTVE